MIELLGIGMPGTDGRWLFRALSARIERAELIAVVSPDREARLALLDAVAGRRIPSEGRVWINGQPLTKQTRTRWRSRVADIDVDDPRCERPVSPIAALPGCSRVGAWWRRLTGSRLVGTGAWADGETRSPGRPGASARRAAQHRALVAQAVVSGPEALVVREVEDDFAPDDATGVRAALRDLVARRRLTVVVSAADTAVVTTYADRVLAIVYARLRFNGPPPLAPASSTPTPGTLLATG
jgi:ABC-type cobalamin/Fe3+-siderophores transport system ATPase subunit